MQAAAGKPGAATGEMPSRFIGAVTLRVRSKVEGHCRLSIGGIFALIRSLVPATLAVYLARG
ncbi:hypothetical protein BDW75DRAFT_246613 [Aspergillus navahoensis]